MRLHMSEDIGGTRHYKNLSKNRVSNGAKAAAAQRAMYEMVPRRQSDFARALTVGPATLNADQCAMARPCGLSPSRSSGIRIHAKAVNAADTRMSGASRLLNTC